MLDEFAIEGIELLKLLVFEAIAQGTVPGAQVEALSKMKLASNESLKFLQKTYPNNQALPNEVKEYTTFLFEKSEALITKLQTENPGSDLANATDIREINSKINARVNSTPAPEEEKKAEENSQDQEKSAEQPKEPADPPPAQEKKPDVTTQSDDYDKRPLQVPKNETEKINSTQTVDEKQSLSDNDPDVLDTLSIGQDGLVVVPSEQRNFLLSNDPNKFRYNYTPGQSGIPRRGPVDASNVTVKNTGFTIVIDKTETNDEISYKIKIKNDGKNCLYIDQIIEIGGTDLSNINPDTKKSQNEPDPLPEIGIILDATKNTTFLKNFVSNTDNLQSQNDTPFSVGIPKHLKQKDNQSEPLCSTGKNEKSNTKSDEKKKEEAKEDEATTSDKYSRANLSKIQTEIIKEAKSWVGFREDFREEFKKDKSKGENKPNVREDATGNLTVDMSLMDAMNKYAGWSKKGGKDNPYCQSFAYMVAYKAAEAAGDTEFLQFLKDAKKEKVAGSTQGFYNFARKRGLVYSTPIQGSIVILQYLTKPQKGHAIIVTDQVQIYALASKKWIFTSVQGNTLGESKAALNEGVFEKIPVFKEDNVAAGPDPIFKYLGCIIPNSITSNVGKSEDALIKAFYGSGGDLRHLTEDPAPVTE